MIQPVVILFLIIASAFAVVHTLAVEASLYWHFWWFDILMHFWGGLLIAMGVFSVTTFRCINLKPTIWLVLGVATATVVVWEFFEWQVGLFDPSLHFPDALYDVILGLCGGLTGYLVLKRFKI